MKPKYYIAMAATGLLLLVASLLLRRRAPRFIRDFFAADTDPLNLAIFRVVFFLLLAFSFSVSNTVWFASIPAELQFPPPGLRWLLAYLPVNEGLAQITSLFLLLFCIMAALGLLTRLSAIFCTLLGFYVLGIPQFYGKINHYHHLVWFAAILAASPSADVLSLDAILAAWKRADAGSLDPPRPSQVYALPLRFVWLSMGAIYFSAGFWKVWTSGYAWAFSDNPKIMMYNKWMELGGWRPIFRIDQYPFLYQMSAAATIIFELSFIFLIFFPAIRLLAPLGGLAFHNMTNLFMRISFWQLQVCYVAFVDWDRLFRSLGNRLYREPMYLVFDGNCQLCRRTIASIRTFDLLHRVSYVNALDEGELRRCGLTWLSQEALLRDIHAVVGRRWWAGFPAYRAVATRLPVLWPLLPFLYVCPVPLVGNRVYRHVADARVCSVEDRPSDGTPYLLRVRTTRQVRAIVFVGALVLYTAILSAVGKIQSWPVAGYPTFEDRDPSEVTVITMTAQDRAGRTREIDPLKEHPRELSSERLVALLGRILASDNDADRGKRLRVLWDVLRREDAESRNAVVVRFYRTTLSSLPEKQGNNLVDRQLLYELRFADPPGLSSH